MTCLVSLRATCPVKLQQFSLFNAILFKTQFLLRHTSTYQSSAELRDLIKKSNCLISATKQILNDMKQRFEKRVMSSVLQREETKIRENLTRDVLSSFIGITFEYQNVQRKFQSDVENKMKMEVLNSKPDADEDVIARALSVLYKLNPASTAEDVTLQTLDNTLSRDRNVNTASVSTESLVASVATKYPTLKVLNDSINELHQLLYHYSFLVQSKRDSCMTSVVSSLGTSVGDDDPMIITQRKIFCTRRVVFCSCFVAFSLLVADIIAAIGI